MAKQVEVAREAIANFINASANDVAFTSGSTDSLNSVATSWGVANLRDGDEVLVCLEDHQSATLPWFNVQALLRRFGVNIQVKPFTMHTSGTYDRKSLQSEISNRTRVIALSHVHHLFGMEMHLPELKQIIPKGTLISLDASQSVGHTHVDVQALDVDFVSFSAHKMFAANGVGILWAKPERRVEMMATRLGGKSAIQLNQSGFELDLSELSGVIECGTLNLPGIFSLIPATQFIASIGVKKVEKYLSGFDGLSL